MQPRHLIVTIDTEEESCWNGRFRAEGNTVQNIARLPQLQQMFDELGIRPTYLVDYPVLDDPASVEILGRMAETGLCELGTHLHPWCNPPLVEPPSDANSYPCNLPADLQEEKLGVLSELMRTRFGISPKSFRAGRWAIDGALIRALKRQDYYVDTTVTPYYQVGGAPRYRGAPRQPYFLGSGDDVCRPGPPGSLLEIPVSTGFAGPNGRPPYRLLNLLEKNTSPNLKLAGLVGRLWRTRRIIFSPEFASHEELVQFAEGWVGQGRNVLVFAFHSPDMMPGGTRYVATAEDYERFQKSLRTVLETLVRRLQFKSVTQTEFYEHFVGGRQTDVAATKKTV